MALKELQVMVVEDHGFQRRIAVRLLAELGVVKVRKAQWRDPASARGHCMRSHDQERFHE